MRAGGPRPARRHRVFTPATGNENYFILSTSHYSNSLLACQRPKIQHDDRDVADGFVVTGQMQAQWEAARLIESHALGVEHSFIYVFKDESGDPHSNFGNYGLIHTNLAPKKALGTINRVTDLLLGLKPNSEFPKTYDVPANFVWQDYRNYRFDAGDESKALIALWQGSHQGSAVSLKIHQPGARTVTLCDPVSGKQSPLSFSWDLNDPNRRTVVIRTSVSDTPELLLIQ